MSKEIKTLFLDIETSPNIVLSWRTGFKINLSHDNIIQERAIICVSYKWAGEKEVHTIKWDKNQCDKKLLKGISKVIAEADEIVAHNGDKYDIKFINGRLAFHNLPPLGEIFTTDTLKQSRKAFYLNSQKLDYLGDYFQLGRKKETGGFGLWKSILMENCEKSMKKMVKYCEQDVKLLEKVYNQVLRYAPRIRRGRAIGNGIHSCPCCGEDNSAKKGTRLMTSGMRYQRRQCKECGYMFKAERL